MTPRLLALGVVALLAIGAPPALAQIPAPPVPPVPPVPPAPAAGAAKYKVDSGLANQSWKDSGDSQRFQDGSFAEAPIAAVEVQGYVYDAKRGLAGVEHYASDRDPYSARRLSLISDLARALEDGRLELHYQPQAEPNTGRARHSAICSHVHASSRW